MLEPVCKKPFISFCIIQVSLIIIQQSTWL